MTISSEMIKAHYESYFGKAKLVTSEYIDVAEGVQSQLQVQLLAYWNVPCIDAVAIATAGLSAAPLHVFKEELILTCYSKYIDDVIFDLVAAIAESIVNTSHPIYRGMTLSLAMPIPNTRMEAIYVYAPVYFPDRFEPIENAEGEKVSIAWLIPIHEAEATWIKQHGWDEFSDLLVSLDPDLLDLNRASIV